MSEYPQHDYDEKFKTVFEKLDRIDSALRGNGQVGMVTRLDRLERSMATVSRIVWLLVAVGLAQVVNMLWGA